LLLVVVFDIAHRALITSQVSDVVIIASTSSISRIE
jgi:hypothetical protein